MMKNKRAVTLLSFGVFPCFIAGFWIMGMAGAVSTVSANRYFSYNAYRLIADTFRGPLSRWLLLTAAGALVFLVLAAAVGTFAARLRVNHRGKLKTGTAVVLWAAIFIPWGWVVNRYLLPQEKFHIVSLAADAGMLIVSVLLVWFLVKAAGKVKWEPLFHRLCEAKSIKIAALGLVGLLVLLNAGAYLFAKAPAARGPNIVFVMIDTLRQDRVGCYGYHRDTTPFIDELAREGILFKKVYSSAPWTKPSVASFLTGLYPNKHRAINSHHVLPGGVLTFGEIMKNGGRHTFWLNAGNNYIGRTFNFQQGFDYFFNERIPADLLTGKFLDLLPRLRENSFFVYLHYMDVHLPYNENEFNHRFAREMETPPFQPGKISHKDIKRRALAGTLSPGDRDYLSALYDGQVRFVDESIKRIVTALKDSGLYEDTILVIASDHGEEFWDHDRFEHGHTVYNELIHVPVIIAGGGITPAVIADPLRSIDIMPTVLNLAGVSTAHYRLDGADVLNKSGSNAGDPPPIFVMGTLRGDEKYSLIWDNKKLIVNTGKKRGKIKLIGYKKRPEFEFYDLSGDPLETEDRVKPGSDRSRVARFKAMLRKFMEKHSLFKSQKTVIDKKTRDELKTLGYF